MGIKPLKTGETWEPSRGETIESYREDLEVGVEWVGETGGEALKDVAAIADSANTGTSELASKVAGLENQPLLLWWDGTGTKPTLMPGWVLINTSTGVVEKGN